MRINRLFLESFGRFKYTSVEFKDGINIVHGDNESGKSTLHSFINGIFYGFLKPNSKTTIYLPNHEKYRPWDDVNYKGSLEIEREGRRLEISRNFLKGLEETKVTDLLTGEEITRSFNMGNSNRIHQPGFELFGVNGAVFNNTLSIGQLGVMTDNKLADEIRERITQSSLGGDENISVDKALERIDSRLKEIGSLRAPTSEFYNLNSSIEDIKDSLKELKVSKQEYYKELGKLDGLKEEREILQKELTELRDKSRTISLWERSVNLRRREELIEKIHRYENELKELKFYEAIDERMLDRALELSTLERIQKAKLEKTAESITYLEDKLSKIEILSPNQIEEIDIQVDDYSNFIKYSSYVENLNEDNISMNLEKNTKTLKIKRVILGLLFFIYIIIQILTSNMENNYLTHIMLLPILYILITNRILSRAIIGDKEIEGYIIKMDEIIKKVNKNSREEYIQFIDDSKSKKISNNRLKEEKNQLQTELDEIVRNYSKEVEYNNDIHEELTEILLYNKVTEIDELREAVKLKNKYTSIREDNQGAIEELEKASNLLTNDEQGEKGYEIIEKPEFYNERYEINDRINELNDILKELEVNISTAQVMLKKLEEDKNREDYLIDELTKKKKDFDDLSGRIKSLTIAKDRILKLSIEMHREFAPIINEEVGSIFNLITNGRYNGVMIDNQLNISVVDERRRVIPISSLSGGTVDQLYFSLRIALSNHLMGEKMPLFLDESFAHYDNHRLKNIVEFLYEISKDRQIFVFTCHNREQEVMEELGLEYNLVHLT